MGAQFTSRTALLETFDGDVAFVEELTQAFLVRCPHAVDELRCDIETGDTYATSRTAHALRGSLGYFDDGAAMEALRRLESLTADDLPQAPEMLRDFELLLACLTRFLAQEIAS